MAKSSKDKAIWANNVYRDAYTRARDAMMCAGEHLQRGDYGKALQEITAAYRQLHAIIDLLQMR